MRFKIKKQYILIFVGFFLFLFFLLLFLNSPCKPGNTQSGFFTIPQGASVYSTIAALKKKQYIRSKSFAYVYARIKKLELQAGIYRISPSMNTISLLHYLSQGIHEIKKITVPEGFTLKKIARLLSEENLVDYDLFLTLTRDVTILQEYHIPGKTLEGYLFPDTYFFGYEDSEKTIIKTFLNNFFNKIPTLPNCPQTPEAIFDMVRLASIIEREYQIDEEAPEMAAVFLNRLKIQMGLQSCATIEYIITEVQEKPHPYRLFESDLKIDHPYNTYKWRGLPPGPISNPGLVSMRAVCNPANSDALYFRLIDEKTGRHIFTKTLSEHNKAGIAAQ